VVNLPPRLLLTARLTALTAISASKLYLCWRLATAALNAVTSSIKACSACGVRVTGGLASGVLGVSILRDMLITDVGMKGQAANRAVNHKVNARY
jgi:hypothetical protein